MNKYVKITTDGGRSSGSQRKNMKSMPLPLYIFMNKTWNFEEESCCPLFAKI
jgi:hypothetical protein